jgi:hypothetical protein
MSADEQSYGVVQFIFHWTESMRCFSLARSPAWTTLGKLLLLALPASSAPGAEVLHWKFEEGETIRYRLQHTVEMTTRVQGQDAEAKALTTLDVVWRLGVVGQDGSCTITQTIERIRYAIRSRSARIDYDSQRQYPNDSLMNSIRLPLEPLVGQELSYKMYPSGRISDLQLSATLQAWLKAKAAGPTARLSQSALQHTFWHAPLVLPEVGVSTSDTWKSESKLELPWGPVESRQRMTYRGAEQIAERKFNAIDVSSVVPADDNTRPADATDRQATGTIHFDNVAGRIAAYAFTQDAAASDANPQQKNAHTLRVTLVD